MKKSAIIGLSLVILISGMFAQSQMTSFTGTSVYKQGMSLEDASHLATVSQTEAIASAQSLLAVTTEPLSAEITVLDGFIVWMVDMGSDIVYVDISNPELNSLGSVADAMYTNAEDDDDDDYDDNDDDEDDVHKKDHDDDHEHEEDDD